VGRLWLPWWVAAGRCCRGCLGHKQRLKVVIRAREWLGWVCALGARWEALMVVCEAKESTDVLGGRQ